MGYRYNVLCMMILALQLFSEFSHGQLLSVGEAALGGVVVYRDIRFRHRHRVTAVALSPNLKQLVTCSGPFLEGKGGAEQFGHGDHEARTTIWNTDGSKRGEIAIHPYSPVRAEFSPDGRHFCTASYYGGFYRDAHRLGTPKVSVWDTETLRMQCVSSWEWKDRYKGVTRVDAEFHPQADELKRRLNYWEWDGRRGTDGDIGFSPNSEWCVSMNHLEAVFLIHLKSKAVWAFGRLPDGQLPVAFAFVGANRLSIVYDRLDVEQYVVSAGDVVLSRRMNLLSVVPIAAHELRREVVLCRAGGSPYVIARVPNKLLLVDLTLDEDKKLISEIGLLSSQKCSYFRMSSDQRLIGVAAGRSFQVLSIESKSSVLDVRCDYLRFEGVRASSEVSGVDGQSAIIATLSSDGRDVAYVKE